MRATHVCMHTSHHVAATGFSASCDVEVLLVELRSQVNQLMGGTVVL